MLNTGFDGSMEISTFGYNKLYNTNTNEKILVNNLNYKSQDLIKNSGLINNFEFLFKNFNADSKILQILKIDQRIILGVFFNLIQNFH